MVTILHSFEPVICISGLVMVNVIAIVPDVTNSLNYAQIGLGILCCIMDIVFLCFLNCSLSNFRRVRGLNFFKRKMET